MHVLTFNLWVSDRLELCSTVRIKAKKQAIRLHVMRGPGRGIGLNLEFRAEDVGADRRIALRLLTRHGFTKPRLALVM